MENFIADEYDDGRRLDSVIASRLPDVSRSLAQALIREGRARINGVGAKQAARVTRGDRIEVEVVHPPSMSARPEDIPLRIVFEDVDLAVIDKPAGLVVHPAPGHTGGTLANALTARFPHTQKMGSDYRPGLVHRLDKDTSGLMVVALTPRALSSLQGQIAARSAGRRYFAVVSGRLEPPRATIDAGIGRDRVDRKRMAVAGIAAREARTSYEVREYFAQYTFLEALLHTGRTHQIRVHLAAVGHPIVGDANYGGQAYPGLGRQFLHAHALAFDSPSTGRRLEFSSPLPDDLRTVLESLRV